jgi:hypothetical protein
LRRKLKQKKWKVWIMIRSSLQPWVIQCTRPR